MGDDCPNGHRAISSARKQLTEIPAERECGVMRGGLGKLWVFGRFWFWACQIGGWSPGGGFWPDGFLIFDESGWVGLAPARSAHPLPGVHFIHHYNCRFTARVL